MLEPAIYYAEHGHPLLPRAADTIAGLQRFFRDEWPTSAATLAAGRIGARAAATVPQPRAGRDLAAVILREAEAAGGDREPQIEAARDAFYRGFVAEAIDRFSARPR